MKFFLSKSFITNDAIPQNTLVYLETNFSFDYYDYYSNHVHNMTHICKLYHIVNIFTFLLNIYSLDSAVPSRDSLHTVDSTVCMPLYGQKTGNRINNKKCTLLRRLNNKKMFGCFCFKLST